MNMYEDICLIIQGPSEDREKIDFMDAIPYYKTLFSEIILSTYTEHLISNEFILKICEENDIKVVLQSIHVNDPYFDCLIRKSFYYQTHTCLKALNQTKKKYTIKHRTDERYSNLHILVEKFLNDDEKLVSGGTLFAPKVWNPYHIGDHLFISKTEKLIKMFQMSHEYFIKLEQKEVEEEKEDGPEYNYATNFLKLHGENPTDENHDELMRKYFDFVPDKYMFPFVIRSNTNDEGNQVWRTLEEYGPLRSQYETIDDILYSPYLPW